jgi:pimeloyl-ACP methyl ester carboxylesterase/ribosomal protein S18 acetylase RimI-like enzyme
MPPRIDVGRAGIACAEAGGGQPAVLLHGSASSAAQWRGLTGELADRFRVLAPDLHGHGGSDPWPGPGPLTLADEAAIVAALAEREGEPIHLVGHSYGAAVALRFAQAHPERLRSLALIEPVAFHLLREAGPACAALLAEIEGVAAAVARAADGSGAGMARFIDFWNGDGAWSRMPAERRAATERRAGAVAAHFAATLAEAAPPGAWRAIRVPTLVACGTETPAPTRLIAETLIRGLPQVRALRVHGAGHMLPLTHAEQVNPAVAAQLEAAAAAALRLRRLGRHDLPEVERHLLALGPLDRHARFGSALGDAAVAAYARRIDPGRAVLVGAVDGPSGRLVGLAEAQPAAAPHRVEMAVSVHAPHRRRGLGRRLLGAAMAAAFEERGAEAAEFLFAPGNRPIVGLVRALGARIGATMDRAEVRRAEPAAPPRAA